MNTSARERQADATARSPLLGFGLCPVWAWYHVGVLGLLWPLPCQSAVGIAQLALSNSRSRWPGAREAESVAIDVALIALFGLLHSVMARPLLQAACAGGDAARHIRPCCKHRAVRSDPPLATHPNYPLGPTWPIPRGCVVDVGRGLDLATWPLVTRCWLRECPSMS